MYNRGVFNEIIGIFGMTAVDWMASGKQRCYYYNIDEFLAVCRNCHGNLYGGTTEYT